MPNSFWIAIKKSGQEAYKKIYRSILVHDGNDKISDFKDDLKLSIENNLKYTYLKGHFEFFFLLALTHIW